MAGEYLDVSVERVAMVDHEGKSGALLERVTLADGRHLIVKRFSPRTTPFVGSTNPLATIAIRGWGVFGETVPADVADPVFALLADPKPLADALGSRPTTLVHGDLATVNMAFCDGQLTLLDWAMPAAAPGAIDIARFVAGCSSVVDTSREQILADYAEAAGPAYDEIAMRLSLLSAFCWLGWNKALDAAEHPDPVVRAREQHDLDWWLRQARLTLDAALL